MNLPQCERPLTPKEGYNNSAEPLRLTQSIVREQEALI